MATETQPLTPRPPLPAAGEGKQTEVTFPVTGMTCASCVRRIERRLGKVDGVHDVNVNLATEKARVVFDPSLVGLPDLVTAVEKAGYGVGELPPEPALAARLPRPAVADGSAGGASGSAGGASPTPTDDVAPVGASLAAPTASSLAAPSASSLAASAASPLAPRPSPLTP